MIKALVVVTLLAATTSAGKKDKSPAPNIQCRVMALDKDAGEKYEGKWHDCKTAEDTAQYIFETLDHPGLIIFVEEQTQIDKKKWSEPKLHSDPLIIPDNDFSDGRNEI